MYLQILTGLAITLTVPALTLLIRSTTNITKKIENRVDPILLNMENLSSKLNIIADDIHNTVKVTDEKVQIILEKLHELLKNMNENITLLIPKIDSSVDASKDLLDETTSLIKETNVLLHNYEEPLKKNSDKIVKLMEEFVSIADKLNNTCSTIEIINIKEDISKLAKTTRNMMCCGVKPTPVKHD